MVPVTLPNIKQNKYFINKKGEIFSKDRYNPNKYNKLKTYIDYDGYERISLDCGNDKRKLFGIHNLVLRTFKPDIPKDMIDPTCDHINMNKRDNRISNLRWLSRSDNSKLANANFRKMSNREYCNLTEDIVKSITNDIIEFRRNSKVL